MYELQLTVVSPDGSLSDGLTPEAEYLPVYSIKANTFSPAKQRTDRRMQQTALAHGKSVLAPNQRGFSTSVARRLTDDVTA